MKYLLSLFLVLATVSHLTAMTPEEAEAKLKTSINESRIIVDICIYEQQWINPNTAFPKGRLIKRAVVTEVYKGTEVSIGDRLEFDEVSDEFPGRFTDFISPVAGELRTLFSRFGPTSKGHPGPGYFGEFFQDGKATDRTYWTFPRTTGVFADAFIATKKDNRAFSIQEIPPTK